LAEVAERQAIRQEKEDEKARHRREVRRRNREFAIDHGIDISKDKFLMSSDDERLNQESDEEAPKQEEPADEQIDEGEQRTIEVVEDEDAADEEGVVDNRAGVADYREDVDAVE
jgi:hypothetical protein